MKWTPEERVQKGITWLDGAAERGKISKYWRNHISVKDIRISQPEKGVIGQLFNGCYTKGLSILNICGYFGGSHFGFIHYPRPYRDNTRLLREAWEKALKTDTSWYEYKNSRGYYIRKVNGVLYTIFTMNGKYTMTYRLAGNVHVGEYKNLDSAKRAVRKLASKK